MRLVNFKRIACVALAIVFCIGASVFPISNNKVSASSGHTAGDVSVGLYVAAPLLDTRLFSSLNQSSDGFDIGYLAGGFNKLFSIGNSSIILLPQVNANFANGTCTSSNSGNIGAYSAVIGSYGSYSEAESAAKSKNGFVAVVNGGFEARVNPSTTAENAKKESGGRPVANPVSGGLTVIDGNSGKILFTFENLSHKLTIRSQNGGSVNLPLGHYTGNVASFNFLGVFEYSVSGGLLWMENIIGLEDYTKCVMANEIGTNYSVETRKAFSVLARTVPFHHKHANIGFDVCTNPACCQVYHGTYRMSEENNEIVDSTRGQICTYEGAPIVVLYHNSNGGASCSSAAAWGGNVVPYLTTVFQEEYNDGDKWKHVYTKQEFSDYITSRGSFSSLTGGDIDVKIVETDPYGSDYITVLSVSDSNGNVVNVKTSENVRLSLGYTSANFKLEYSKDMKVLTADGTIETRAVSGVMTADGYKAFDGFNSDYKTVQGVEIEPDKVTVNGSGIGHGVGFSATGSEKLSKDGYSYKYILGYFFNNTEIEYLS
ncbi:MAG: SpoIID/LytB domain-containing protein [Clostridia bacterium]|nr:SpoIID/LytB domain-containing protein [Clostridia bacterium]